MILGSALFIVAVLLVLGLLLRPLANRLLLPFEALLLALGFAFGSLYVDAQQLGIEPDVLRTLVFYVVLPVLIFSTAYSINAPQLARNLLSLLILAVPVALISLALSSVLIYYGIGHPSGFPWLAALLTGTMLMATDNRALRHTFEHLGLSDELRVLINGEDLLNNATSIVLFTLILGFATQGMPTPSQVMGFLVWNVLGGILIGLILGFIALVFLRMRKPETVERAILTVLVAHLSYLVADQLLGASGVLSVLIAALIMGRTMHEDLYAAHDDFVDEFWHLSASLSGYLLYVVLGLLITLDLNLFSDRWLAILIGAGAVVLARIVGLAVIMPILVQRHSHLIDVAHHNILFFTGTRGAVTLGLALSVPPDLEYYWTIEAIGFGVVLLTLLAQAPFLELFRKKKKNGLETDPTGT